ncbi:MAG: hypothetical protein K1X66_05360 [Verrucomicrobiae bacterium]|nr:hypothetical protein [Verrucomicrobiae bacterium]
MNTLLGKCKFISFLPLCCVGMLLGSSLTVKAASAAEYALILAFQSTLFVGAIPITEATPFWLGSDATSTDAVVIDTRIDNLDGVIAAYQSNPTGGWSQSDLSISLQTNYMAFLRDPNRNLIEKHGKAKGKVQADGSVLVTVTMALSGLPITVYDKAGFVDMLTRSFDPTVPQVLYGDGSGNGILQAEFFTSDVNAPLNLNQAFADGDLVSLSMTLTGEAYKMNADGSHGQRVHVFYQSRPNSVYNGSVLDNGRVMIQEIGN